VTITSSPSFVTRTRAYKYFKRDSTATFNSDVGIYTQDAGRTQNTKELPLFTITDIINPFTDK